MIRPRYHNPHVISNNLALAVLREELLIFMSDVLESYIFATKQTFLGLGVVR